MLTKILSYQSEALKKPVFLCAAILDPRVKIKYINEDTLSAAGLLNKDELVKYFTNQAHTFDIPSDPYIEIIAPPSSDEDDDD